MVPKFEGRNGWWGWLSTKQELHKTFTSLGFFGAHISEGFITFKSFTFSGSKGRWKNLFRMFATQNHDSRSIWRWIMSWGHVGQNVSAVASEFVVSSLWNDCMTLDMTFWDGIFPEIFGKAGTEKVQGGPPPVRNRFITLTSRIITPLTHLFLAIYRGSPWLHDSIYYW